jgi:hypothetical protein
VCIASHRNACTRQCRTMHLVWHGMPFGAPVRSSMAFAASPSQDFGDATVETGRSPEAGTRTAWNAESVRLGNMTIYVEVFAVGRQRDLDALELLRENDLTAEPRGARQADRLVQHVFLLLSRLVEQIKMLFVDLRYTPSIRTRNQTIRPQSLGHVVGQ